MGINILTWSANTNNGAFQKVTEYGCYSDLITTKPVLSFDFIDMAYIEQTGEYRVDGMSMTDDQKIEIAEYIDNTKAPDSFYLMVKTKPHIFLLRETDWYVTRKAETGVSVPEDIMQKRAAARLAIDAIRAEYNAIKP